MTHTDGASPHPPMPMIVGVPRSGTTLLRLMLDAHPKLAIPPETGFIPEAIAQQSLRGHPRRTLKRAVRLVANRQPLADSLCDAFLHVVTELPSWADFHIAPELFRETLSWIQPFTLADGIRNFYRLYAQRFNKPRWGDKTPNYALHLETIGKCLPEAHFIHLIRDGRDMALSVKGLWFAPGKDIEMIARDWCRRIRIARRQGQNCRHYFEVRYEDLVINAVETLGRICDYINLTYDVGMEKYYVTVHQRLNEHESRYNADGRVKVTKEERLHWQRLTTLPPDRSRIGRWKHEMSKEDHSRFKKVAGEMLEELGYTE